MGNLLFEYSALAVCAALAAGEACGFRLAPYGAFWPVAAASAALVALFGYGLPVRGWRFVFAFLAGLALALAAGVSRDRVLDEAVRFAGSRPYPAEVRVAADAREGTGRDGARSLSFAGAVGPVRVKVLVAHAPEGTDAPRAGETWLCTGWMSRDESPGGVRILRVCGTGTSVRRLRARGLLADLLFRVRSDLSRRVGLGLAGDPGTADLNRAILLGERARIDPETREDFVAAGTVHIFAISGLHVIIVAKTLLVLFVVCFLPLRFARLAVIPVLWAYTLLVGAPPSAVRATVMATFYFAAPAFWRRPNALLAWAYTFLAVHVLAPERLFDVGSALSFAVMLALVLWGRLASRAGLRGAAAAFGVTAVAWAAGVPIAARVFGRVTPGGLVANLAAVPVAGGTVVGGVTGVFASFLSSELAAHVNNAAALFTRLVAGLSRAVASLPGANFEVEPWPLWKCVLWYAAFVALAALFIAVRRKRDRI